MKQYSKGIRAKLFTYFQNKLGIKKSTKGFYRCDCPYCGGNYTFGVNVSSSRAHCFKCGEHKSPIQVLMDLENIQELRVAYTFINTLDESTTYDDYRTYGDLAQFNEISLPEGYQLITQSKGYLAEAARNYLRGRGFSIKKMEALSVGYSLTGEYKGYIIYPIYRRGKLIFYQGRKFIDLGPKMKNAMESEVGIGKSQIIYNEDAMYMYNTIYLMESITNCHTMGEQAVGTLGKDASPAQIQRIIKAPFKNLIICLDPDALDKAINLALLLCNYKRCKLLILPESKDVNDVGKDYIRKLSKATPYMKYMEFYKMKLNYDKITLPTYNRGPVNRMPTRGF